MGNRDRPLGSLSEAWASYRARVVGPFAEPSEVATAREAFYSGAGAALAVLLDDATVETIDRLRRELERFAGAAGPDRVRRP